MTLLPRRRHGASARSPRRLTCLGLVALTLCAGCSHRPPKGPVTVSRPSPVPSATAEVVPPAAAPAADLPVITYGPAPGGFAPDPGSMSVAPLGEGVHPVRTIAAYDAPGGQPRAFLAPNISGVDLTMPIVQHRSGWTAVLLPSVNRTIGWLPPSDGWKTVPLRDQLVVYRSKHQLDWFRDGALVRSWPVTLGSPQTPTPLGRTFILGRSSLPGEVYAGTDVFALGAVPDKPDAVPTGLRGAHIGLHTWHNDATIGMNVTDGCIRVTKAAQQQLLKEIAPGTELLVLDEPAQPAATN